MSSSPDSLAELMPYLMDLEPGAATDPLLEWLAPVDRKKLAGARKRLECVLKIKVKTVGDRGRKSNLVGRLYEAIVDLLFSRGDAVSIHSNVRSTTSEIDTLLSVKPLGKQFVPFLAAAGTHIMAEVKCKSGPPKVELVNELAAFSGTHGTNDSLLFVNCTSRRLHHTIRTQIALHWVKGQKVVPIGKAQLNEIEGGRPVLAVVADQYVAASASLTSLSI